MQMVLPVSIPSLAVGPYQFTSTAWICYHAAFSHIVIIFKLNWSNIFNESKHLVEINGWHQNEEMQEDSDFICSVSV